MADVKITIHEEVVNRILNVNEVPRMVNRTGRAVLAAVIGETPVGDSGAMRAANRRETDIAPFRYVKNTISNTDEAAWWVNRGTGLYSKDGPKARIFPRSSPVLVFPARNYPAKGGKVFARSVAGQEPNEFMWRGLLEGTGKSGYIWSVRKNLP